MLDVIWLIPAFPLVGFLLILLFGRRLGEPGSGYLAATMVLGSFIVSVGAYFDLLSMDEHDRAHVESLFSWVPVSSLQIDMAFLADPLSIRNTVPGSDQSGQIHIQRMMRKSCQFDIRTTVVTLCQNNPQNL